VAIYGTPLGAVAGIIWVPGAATVSAAATIRSVTPVDVLGLSISRRNAILLCHIGSGTPFKMTKFVQAQG